MLATPILSNISTFDPSESNIISFYYTGGQIEKKRLVVKNNTGATVYDNTQLGMRLDYELPAQKLTAGQQYTAQIQVFDFNDNSSELSSSVIFYCFSNPVVSFDSPPSKINSAQYTAHFNFSQKENDTIKQYRYELYDIQHQLVSTSEYFYDNKHYSYTFRGLKNLTNYYIRCTGETVHNVSFDTGFTELTINYIVQPNNMILRTTNNSTEGYITVDCNIIDIGYKVENDNYSFGKDGVTLVNNNVVYNSGFNFSDNFSIFIKAKEVPLNSTFFSFQYDGGILKLSIIRFATKYYCKLETVGTICNFTQYVELPNVAILDETGKNIITDEHGNILQQVTLDYVNNYITVFEIKRKNNLYELKAYYENNGYFEV